MFSGASFASSKLEDPSLQPLRIASDDEDMGQESSKHHDVPAVDVARTQVARIKAIVGARGADRKASSVKPGRTAEGGDQDIIMVSRWGS